MPPRPFRARSHLLVLLLLLFASFASPLVFAANPCRDCHADVFARLDAGPHRAVVERDGRFCTSCHGDAAKHIASPEAANIIGAADLAKWSSEMKAGACASCHAREFPAWRQAAHAAEGLCWSCHSAEALHFATPSEETPLEHGAGRLTVPGRAATNQCLGCHAEVSAQQRMQYRHPLANGQVTCSSCHDIHGRQAGEQPAVADAACLRCHEEQSGPFLFAHAALEDGCATCHSVHGSAHRGQLRTAGNGVCLSCHVQTNFPSLGSASHDFRLSGGGRCWDCHSEVHGSNTTPDFNPRGRR